MERMLRGLLRYTADAIMLQLLSGRWLAAGCPQRGLCCFARGALVWQTLPARIMPLDVHPKANGTCHDAPRRRHPCLQHLWPPATVQRPWRHQVPPLLARPPATSTQQPPLPRPRSLPYHGCAQLGCTQTGLNPPCPLCSRAAGSLGVAGLADELAEPLLFCELMVFGT